MEAYYKERGIFQGRFGFGKRPALVVIDMAYGWTDAAYGPPSPARGILLSIYLAILLVSAGLLLRPVADMVAALLIVQIAYKVTTPITVRTLANPVVLSNLAIAAVHLVTVHSIAAVQGWI